MRRKLSKTLIVVLVFIAFSYIPPVCTSENYTRTYNLLDRPGGTELYKLNIFIPQSLYEYYVWKDHKQLTEEDFAKFVTPHALKPIADRLWEIYHGDHENFANGVLMIVHQIPYEATTPAKYPVETIVENKGDCDQFSYIAASIIKAIGLDVVLLYYKNKAHMNIGVNLPKPPRYTEKQAYYVDYDNTRYYIAECTGGNWKNGWKVGQCPPNLIGEKPIVITLEKCESRSPGQISASYATLASSTISLTVSPTLTIQASTITLSGKLTPNIPNEKITVYIKSGNSPWIAADVATTDSYGKFTYSLTLNEAGICYIRVSWSGNKDHAGADSPIVSVIVLPVYLITLFTVIIILVCASIIAFLTSSQAHKEIKEQRIPEVPTLRKSFFTIKQRFIFQT